MERFMKAVHKDLNKKSNNMIKIEKPLRYIKSQLNKVFNEVTKEYDDHPLYTLTKHEANKGNGAWVQMMAQQIYHGRLGK